MDRFINIKLPRPTKDNEYIVQHLCTSIGQLEKGKKYWLLKVTDGVWGPSNTQPRSHLAARLRQIETLCPKWKEANG